MTAGGCSAHPVKPAAYRCDDCERLLCEECIDEGHRLLFCRHCGERALPLVDSEAATSVDLSRQRAVRMEYTRKEAMAYPFRGLGGYVFWGLFAVLAAFRAIEAVTPFAGLALLVPRFLIGVLMPGLLFSIVRTTARGEMELPDWPDWVDGERMREFVSAFMLGVFTLLPAGLLFLMAGCGVEELLYGGLGCWALIFVGLGIGFLIWIPSFAAVAAFGPGMLVLRLDLHVRAFFATHRETVRVALLTIGLTLAGGIVTLVLTPVPLLGGLAALWIDLYAMFVSTHLIGLLLRKHERDLEPIYCY